MSAISIVERRRAFQVAGNSHSSLNSRSGNSSLGLWRHRACMQHRVLHKTCLSVTAIFAEPRMCIRLKARTLFKIARTATCTAAPVLMHEPNLLASKILGFGSASIADLRVDALFIGGERPGNLPGDVIITR